MCVCVCVRVRAPARFVRFCLLVKAESHVVYSLWQQAKSCLTLSSETSRPFETFITICQSQTRRSFQNTLIFSNTAVITPRTKPLCLCGYISHFLTITCCKFTYINLQEPCVLYIGRAHRYPPNTPFYIFFQHIYVLNFLNMLHTLRFFLFKMPFIS